MRLQPKEKGGGNKEQVINDQGKVQKEVRTHEIHCQDNHQEWIPVMSRKARAVYGNKNHPYEAEPQQEEEERTSNLVAPIMVEEGEIIEDHETLMEEEENGEEHGTKIVLVTGNQRQNMPQLIKTNSDNQLVDQGRKEDKLDRSIVKSSSMTDLPEQCKESRLEYLREEFTHLHLINKHLRRTKEETQKRMRMMEIRQNQNLNYQDDIQKYLDSLSQEERVPETQMDKTHKDKIGENSQKKKKLVDETGNRV